MIKLFNTHISEVSISNAVKVLQSGFLNQGPIVEEVEGLLSDFMPNPVTLNSCTAALHVALDICNVRGKEVLLPAQTFIATGLAVLMAGGIPVFVDVNPYSGLVSYHGIKNKINKNTAAIIIVDWAGNIAYQDKFKEFNVPIIQDAAHSFGGKKLGIYNGNLADFTCFSFQSIKTLTCGDGGLLTCLHPKYAHIARELRWFGIDKYHMTRTEYGDRKYDIERIGYKYNMNDLDASILLGNMTDIFSRIDKRRANYVKYKSIKNPNVILVDHNDGSSHWLCNLIVSSQLEFIQYMKRNEVECSVVDRRIDTHKIFKYDNNLQGQSYFDSHQVNIPIHDDLSDNDIDKIINLVNKWKPHKTWLV